MITLLAPLPQDRVRNAFARVRRVKGVKGGQISGSRGAIAFDEIGANGIYRADLQRETLEGEHVAGSFRFVFDMDREMISDMDSIPYRSRLGSRGSVNDIKVAELPVRHSVDRLIAIRWRSERERCSRGRQTG
jgi:hypothetical protein